MTTLIYTDIANVKSVQYTLHAPAGTSVVRIAYPDGYGTTKERVDFYADGAAGSYDTATAVYTKANITAAVTMTTTVVNTTGVISRVVALGLTNAVPIVVRVGF